MDDFLIIYDFERAVLSAFVFEPSLLDSTTILEKHFSHPFHQNFFNSLKHLKDSGLPIEENLIIQDLHEKKVYNDEGFFSILAAIPVSNIEPYVSKIKAFSADNHFTTESKHILADDTLTAQEKLTKIKQLERVLDTGSSLPSPTSTKNVSPQTPFFYLKAKLPIQKNEITLITGRGGIGKSYVSIWLAATLAKEERLRVFTYLSEDSAGNTKNRLETIRKTNPFLKDADFDFWGKEVRPGPFLRKTADGFVPSSFWYDFKSRLDGYDIVLLDPLIAFIAEDENSNVEARVLFNLLNEWCEKDDKTIIIIHHHNKEDKIRGASAFVDAVRLHFVLEEKNDSPQDRFLAIEKANHYAGISDFRIRLFGEMRKSGQKPRIGKTQKDPNKITVPGGTYEKF